MNFTETVNNIIYKKIVKTVTVQDRAALHDTVTNMKK